MLVRVFFKFIFYFLAAMWAGSFADLDLRSTCVPAAELAESGSLGLLCLIQTLNYLADSEIGQAAHQ